MSDLKWGNFLLKKEISMICLNTQVIFLWELGVQWKVSSDRCLVRFKILLKSGYSTLLQKDEMPEGLVIPKQQRASKQATLRAACELMVTDS